MSDPVKIQHFGLQIMGTNQYIKWVEPKVTPLRWRVKKLKRIKALSIGWQILIWIMLWLIFGITYSFMAYPEQSLLVVIFIVICVIIGFFGSFIFDK